MFKLICRISRDNADVIPLDEGEMAAKRQASPEPGGSEGGGEDEEEGLSKGGGSFYIFRDCNKI